MAHQQLARQEESLGDLFSELAEQTGDLVRQEVALAQAEITEKAAKAGRQIAFIAVGGAVAYAAFLTLLASAVAGLSYLVPVAVSALIIGLIVGIAGYFLISSAIEKLKNTQLKPRETVESIKEDAEWLKKQIS